MNSVISWLFPVYAHRLCVFKYLCSPFACFLRVHTVEVPWNEIIVYFCLWTLCNNSDSSIYIIYFIDIVKMCSIIEHRKKGNYLSFNNRICYKKEATFRIYWTTCLQLFSTGGLYHPSHRRWWPSAIPHVPWVEVPALFSQPPRKFRCS